MTTTTSLRVTMGRFVRTTIAMVALTLPSLLLSAQEALAADSLDASITLDIAPNTPVEEALIEWGAKTQMTVMINTQTVDHQITRGIRGSFNARQALALILRDTNLTYTEDGDRILVVPGSQLVHSSLRTIESPTATETHGNPSSGHDDSDSQLKHDRERLDEVVVTAQKREERLKDVPISITVLDGASLDNSSTTSVTDALSAVPGLATLVSLNGDFTQIVMRGVSGAEPFQGGASPIGYYLDTIPFGLVKSAFAPDEDAYDLQRVEVLRGPQGTLYGANSEGGLVRVLTNDADLHAFDLKARGGLSTTDGGAGNYRGDFAVNVPIIDGALALRAVVGYDDESGWVGNADKTHLNDGVLRNYRLKVNAQPTDAFTIGLSTWSSRDDFGAPATSTNSGQTSAVLAEPIATQFDADSVKLGYRHNDFRVESTTGYLDYRNVSYLDFTPLGLPQQLYTQETSHVLSEEFLLNSSGEGPWHWTGGIFYRDGEDHLIQELPLALPAPYDVSYGSRSIAVFGQLGRKFFQDQFEWAVGLRYFHDDVSVRENVQTEGLVGVPLSDQTTAFHAVTPRAVLSWYADPDLTLYATYSQGFRSGAPQDPIVVDAAPGFPALKPDKLYNYELGAKGDLFHNLLTVDSAVYYMDWKDVQLPLDVDFNGIPVSAQINSQSASGAGIDLSLTFHPFRGFNFGASGSWNNLRVDGSVYSGGLPVFLKGDRLGYSPEYTAAGFVDYSFPLAVAGLRGQFATSVNVTSPETGYMLIGTTNYPSDGDRLVYVKASFAINSQTHWTARLFVDNLTNERGTVLPGQIPDWALRARPRTAGLQLEYHFR